MAIHDKNYAFVGLTKKKDEDLAVSEKKYVKEIELIRSIPGIGLVTGLTFLSKIEDIE